MISRVILRPGKDKALRQHHPWIFSGAIASGVDNADGDLRQVYDARGELLGSGYFNAKSSICGRMVCFDSSEPLEAIRRFVHKAIALRQSFFHQQDTTGFRLINGEGDFLPGLVVDRYGDTLVIQISTKGMDKLRSFVVEVLVEAVKPSRIYEKSSMPSRKEEGLEAFEQWLLGNPINQLPFRENGLQFLSSPVDGQKTGFFLDQREMRQKVRCLAKDKKVLNCFSYSGAFTVAALAGGAVTTASVDISSKAIELAKEQVAINGFDIAKQSFFTEDVFEFLRRGELNFDFIILDPPAFSKKRQDVVTACRGYKDINRLAMKGMPEGSLLLTSSCSHFVDDLLFQKVIFQASVEARRKVKILDRHHYAPDHPVNLCHPEGHYLKSLLLWVE